MEHMRAYKEDFHDYLNKKYCQMLLANKAAGSDSIFILCDIEIPEFIVLQ